MKQETLAPPTRKEGPVFNHRWLFTDTRFSEIGTKRTSAFVLELREFFLNIYGVHFFVAIIEIIHTPRSSLKKKRKTQF